MNCQKNLLLLELVAKNDVVKMHISKYSLSCFFLVVLFFFFSGLSIAQSKLKVEIVLLDSNAISVIDGEALSFEARDSVAVLKKLDEFARQWANDGYISSGFDSLKIDSVSANAFFYLGQRFLFNQVDFSNVSATIIREAGLERMILKNKAFKLKHFVKLREEIVKHYENNGYPFVQVKIDSVLIDNKHFKGRLTIEENPFYRIDSVVVKGKPKISRKFLIYSLAVKPNEVYNQSKIDELDDLIENLPYLQMAKPVEIEFREAEADLYLYLKNKPANFFNGIIGLASPTEENENYLITGDLSLVLVNSFKIGEQFNLFWNRYDENSQKLNLGFQFPYLFFLPIGIDFQFGLEKFNVDYLNTSLKGGLEYSITKKNKIKAFLSQNNSILISNEEEQQEGIEETKRFTAGLSFLLEHTDYKFNPSKGFSFEASSGFGSRSTSSLGTSQVIEIELKAAYYLKFGKMITLALLNKSAAMFNEFDFYENELYKIGGINDLRGFDEQSVYASSYSVFSIEPRLLFGKNSALYLFGDVAWYESRLVDSFATDVPIGIGLGANLETRAGIFKINYAVGKQFDNPLKFSDAKVHFGFSARF